jgi:hypothetical protein
MREDLPKYLRTQASALPGRPLKETSDLLLEAATEVETLRRNFKFTEKVVEEGYKDAYQIIADLTERLKTQKKRI